MVSSSAGSGAARCVTGAVLTFRLLRVVTFLERGFVAFGVVFFLLEAGALVRCFEVADVGVFAFAARARYGRVRGAGAILECR